MHRFLASAALLALGWAGACVAAPPAADRAQEEHAIAALLDGWHAAAARADGAEYFGRMSAEAVFLGTDPGERWTLAEFRAFCEPYFAQGRGWTYVPAERHIQFGPDGPAGNVAWFDERLTNAKYGTLHGVGTVQRVGGAWKIALYDMTIPIPNDLTLEFVDRMRAFGTSTPAR